MPQVGLCCHGVELIASSEGNEAQPGVGNNGAEMGIGDDRHIVAPCFQCAADTDKGMHIAGAADRKEENSHCRTDVP